MPPRTPAPWYNINLYRPRMENQRGRSFFRTPPTVERTIDKVEVSHVPTKHSYPPKRGLRFRSLRWLFTI